jgi:molybdopterin-guanine dinucleotide biosynthesis protein A
MPCSEVNVIIHYIIYVWWRCSPIEDFTQELCGVVVLAGGASQRMGQDKWLLPLGQTTVIERIITELQPLATELWVITANENTMNDQHKFPDLTLKFPAIHMAHDVVQGVGPLGGIAAGLRYCSQPYIFVAASDMPFPSMELAHALINLCQRRDSRVAVPEFSGRMHPLFAAYRGDCLESLTAYLEGGGRKVMDWLQTLDVAILPEKEIEQLDPEGIALFNMNRHEDYALALKIIQQKAGG